ncbi:MAG: VOC family protein [Phycisphaerales bacterium]
MNITANLLGAVVLCAATGAGLHNGSSEARNDVPSVAAEDAAAVYERFKNLAGEWVGKSTKGWTDREVISVIARESAVMIISNFEAHPGETMATMIHMDGDRLMLTHYCVARNQPRLEATLIEDDGRTITFTFRDGTNLPSRDTGHMDKAIFRFVDDTRYSSRWTFYRDGQESWMEQIVYERIADEPSSAEETNTAGTDRIGFDGGLTCVIAVSDLSTAKSWYQDVLGFELLFELPDQQFCELASPVDRVTVGLSQVSDFKTGSGTTLTFGVRDIAVARTVLEHRGVRFDGPTEEIPGIVKLASLFDPDNNRLMLYESLTVQD